MWKWLSQPTPLPEPPRIRTDYPFGTCVQTETGYWLIRDKMRFKIPTERTLASWSFNIVPSTESAVKHYKTAGKLGFRDGTLIKNAANGKMYIIAANKKRHITNPDFFDNTLIDRAKMVEVSDYEAELHEDGEVLS